MCKIADGIVFILLVMCSVFDWRKRTIPVMLLIVLTTAVGIFVLCCDAVSVRLRVGGIFLGSLFFIISKITKEAIGYGDSWLILLLGVYMGYLRAIGVLFTASVLAGLVSVFFLWKRHWKRTATLPFVPFLSISYLGAMLL